MAESRTKAIREELEKEQARVQDLQMKVSEVQAQVRKSEEDKIQLTIGFQAQLRNAEDEISRLKSDIEDLNEKLDVANKTKIELLELKAESEDAIRKHKEAQSELNLMSDEISNCL